MVDDPEINMKTNGENAKMITHDFPVWRKKANFIVAAQIREPDISDLVKWEQIWTRQLEENVFEICCIPFLVYGLSLGDFVNTTRVEGEDYIIDEIVKKNGHITYRVWFFDISEWDIVVKQIKKLGCLVEIRWDKSKLIAVDVPTIEARKKLEVYLTELEAGGSVKCEIAE